MAEKVKVYWVKSYKKMRKKAFCQKEKFIYQFMV